MSVSAMRRLRIWITVLLVIVPLAFLGAGSYRFVHGIVAYLNTGARLAGTLSAEATRLLGRDVRVGDVKITGNLFSLAATNRVELRDVSIAENAQPPYGQLAHVNVIRLRYSLAQILFPTNLHIPYLDEVQLLGPEVAVRRNANGQWNFAPFLKLIKPSKVVTRPAINHIAFTNGALLYQDARFPHPPGVPARPFTTRIADASGNVFLNADQTTSVDVAALAESSVAQNFRVVGILGPGAKRIDAWLTADRLNLPTFASRFLPPSKISVSGGFANVDAGILYVGGAGAPGRIRAANLQGLRGNIQISDLTAAGSLLGATLQHVNATATVGRESLSLDAKGVYAGATAQVVGSLLGYPWLPGGSKKNGVLSVQGSVQNANIGRIAKVLPEPALTALPPDFRAETRRATGQGNFDFRVTGALTNPVATLTAHLNTVQYMGFQSQNLNVHALYANHLIHADLRGRYGGGDAVVRAQVAMDKVGAFQLEAHGRGLQLAKVGIPLKEPLGGTGNVDVVMKGRQGRTPLYSAQAEVFNVKYHKETFARAYARAETRGRELAIRTLRVEDPKASVVANGTMDLRNYALNMNVDADELNLGALMGALHAPSAKSALATLLPSGNSPQTFGPPAPGAEPPLMEGFAEVRGKLTGTLSRPLLNAHVDAFAVETSRINFDRISANLDLTRNALVISQGTARHYLGDVRFSGVAAEPFASNPTLRLTVGADSLDLADLLRTAGMDLQDLAITGTVSTDNILIAGKPSALQIRSPFTATFEGVTVNGQPVTDASVVADYGPQGLEIAHAGLTVAGGTLAASGRIAKNGQLDLTARGQGFQLATLPTLLPRDINMTAAGTLGFTVTATGTASAPNVQMQVDARDLAVNTVPLGNLQGTATYANKQAELHNVTLSGDPAAPGEKITLSALTYDPATKRITGAADWSAVPLQQLRQLAQASLDTTTESGRKTADTLAQFTSAVAGSLAGSLTLDGTTDNPDVALRFNADNIQIGSYPPLKLTGTGNFNKTQLLIPQAQLTSAEANLEVDVKGVQAVYDGDIKADVSAYNLDLGLLQRLFLQKSSLNPEIAQRAMSGTGDIGMLVSGKTKSPVVELSVNMRDVSFAAPAALPSMPAITGAGPAPTATATTPAAANDAVIDHIDLYDATVKEGSISGSLRVVKNGTIENKPVQIDLRAVGSVGFSWKPPYIPDDAPLDVQIGGANQAAMSLPFPILSLLARTVALNLSASGPAAVPADPLSDSQGSLTLAARVGGTLANPRLSGSLGMSAARIHISGFDTGLRDVDGMLQLQGNQVTVGPNFRAQTQVYVNGKPDPNLVGSPIVFSGSLPLGLRGTGRPPPGPGMTLSADSIPFLQSPLPGSTSGSAKGIAQANLRITGSVREPTLAGTLLVRDTTMSLPSNFGAVSGGVVALPISPHFDLHLRIDRNVRLTNPLLSARIDGDIALAGTLGAPHVQGVLTIEQGSFKLPTARPFTILPPGTLRMIYPVYQEGLESLPALQLDVDMRAQTQITATSIYGVRKNYQVTVTARGPVLGSATDPITGAPRLALSFQTDPPDLAVNQQEMVQRLAGVLGGADVFSQLGRNPGEALAAGLTDVFSNAVLPGLFEGVAKSTGFQEITVGYDPVQRLNLTLTRRLFGPLYFTYVRSLTGVQNYYDVKFSLRFKQRYQLSYDFTNADINTGLPQSQILLEGVWNF